MVLLQKDFQLGVMLEIMPGVKCCIGWRFPIQKIHYSQKVNRCRKRGMAQLKKIIETILKAEDNEDRIAGSPCLRDFAYQEETFAREVMINLRKANSKLKRRSHQGDEKVCLRFLLYKGDSGIDIQTPSPCCRQQKQGNECWQFMSLLDYIVIYEPSISPLPGADWVERQGNYGRGVHPLKMCRKHWMACFMWVLATVLCIIRYPDFSIAVSWNENASTLRPKTINLRHCFGRIATPHCDVTGMIVNKVW